MDEVRDLFLCGRPDGDGADKTEQYRARALAQAATRGHTSRADYLASLDLRVEVRRDRYDAIRRIAELSQKSNQFNLTTIRYTEAQVADLIAAHDAAVYTLRAGDRFGDAGIVAIAVVHFAGGTARVESFLMSCRILGRGVEFAPWPIIAADAQDRGCRRLEAEWRASRRNQQVGDFYDRLGLPRLDAAHDRHVYRADLAEVSFPVQSHIRINHG
jgi:FkbH-like protein